MRRLWSLLGALVLGLGGLSACGYHFTAGGAPLPSGIRHVFVPVFANHTPEPNAEVVFTQAMREQLGRAGSQGGQTSEARLEGDLRSLSNYTGLSLTNVPNGPPVYRIGASLRLRLLKGRELVAQADVDGSEDYLSAGGDILATEANRQAALARLAQSLTQDGYGRLVGGF
jgi:hypothetical protein